MSERRRSKAGSSTGKTSLRPQIAANTINRIKVLSMGSGGSGKSCLIKRFCEERFVTKYIATIGVDYGVKPITLDGMDVRVNFWDLSGHQEFFEIRNEFYKDTQGIVLVYDMSNRDSFDELDMWLSEAAKYGANPRDIPVALVATKSDKRPAVSEDEGQQYAQARGLTFFETSAMTGENVSEMFDFVFQSISKTMKA
jgi:DnaJ homolog subfamily C member 27